MSDAAVWTQVRTQLKHIALEHESSLLIAGSFGAAQGGDLDVLLVFQPDTEEAVASFFSDMKALIGEFAEDHKHLEPFLR